MESLIPHLIKNPTWMSLSMIFTIFFLFFFLILSLSFAAQADEEKEKVILINQKEVSLNV